MAGSRSRVLLGGGLALLGTAGLIPFVAPEDHLLALGQGVFSRTALGLAGQHPGFWLQAGPN